MKYIATDLGLTGFISVCSDDDGIFKVIDSFKIIIESKDKKIMKSSENSAIVKNQISFTENFNKIFDHFDCECIGLFEQITTRPFNSAVSSNSLTDSSCVFRCIFEALEIDYRIIPPANWKRELGVTKDKKTSKDLFDKLVNSGKIAINDNLKSLKKKLKNHNQVESVLIAYYYYKVNKSF